MPFSIYLKSSPNGTVGASVVGRRDEGGHGSGAKREIDRVACPVGISFARTARVTKGNLLNLRRMIVGGGVRGGARHAGQLRREAVQVGDFGAGGTVIHHSPPPWAEVEALLDWVEASKHRGAGPDDTWVRPVILAGITQHRLVWIHPFVDGDGRTARMLATLLLYQRGDDFKFLFKLSGYYNRDRDEYYAALRTGDYTEWLTYFHGSVCVSDGGDSGAGSGGAA